MDSLQLQKTIQQLKAKDDSIPSECLKWIDVVISTAVDTSQLTELSGKVSTLLDQVGGLLDKHTAETSNLIQQYPSLITSPPSNLLQSMQQFRSQLAQSKESDRVLESRLKSSNEIITLLKQGPDHVNQVYLKKISAPSLIDTNFDEIGDKVILDTLLSLQSKLQSLKKMRKEALENLKVKIHSDDIAPLLLLNKGREEILFKSELEKYTPITASISNSVKSQEGIFKEIQKTLEKLTATSTFKCIETKNKARFVVVNPDTT